MKTKDYNALQAILDRLGDEWLPEIKEFPGAKIHILYDPDMKGYSVGLYREDGQVVEQEAFNDVDWDDEIMWAWQNDEVKEITIKEHNKRISDKNVGLKNDQESGHKGLKNDQGKSRLDLIPSHAIEEVGQVMGFGASKYGEHNYLNGMDWLRLVGAIQRHTNAFVRGEDLDKESGLNHLAHAASSALMLLEYIKRGIGNDNRYTK